MNIFVISILVLLTVGIISTSAVFGEIDSPRKQMADGVSAEDVVCKNELQLMLRINGAAICVKSSTVERFQNSGFAKIIDTSHRVLEKNEESDTEEAISVNDTDISLEKILVNPKQPTYSAGSMMVFTGTAHPNQILEVSLEDPNGREVYVDILEIDGSGQVNLEVITDDSLENGTYFLILTQSNDSEIIPVNIGSETGEIALVVEKFHFDLNSKAILELYGPNSSNLSLTVINPQNHLFFFDTVDLDSTGFAEYKLDLSGYKTGVYSIVMTYASEETIEEFTVGLGNGTKPMEITLDDDYYKLGETATVFGTTEYNIRILIEVIDPSGETIDQTEYYSDNDGKFVYPIEISLGKQTGTWKVFVSNAEYSSKLNFEVVDETPILTIKLNEEGPFKYGDFVTISGTGLNPDLDSVIHLKSTHDQFELTPTVSSEGAYSASWIVPDYAFGEYTISIGDGENQVKTKLIIVE